MILQIMGRLGKDPEMRYTPEGIAVTTINVAEDRKYTTKSGEEKKNLWWFRCTAWNKTAETIAKWFTKGKGIYLIGELVSTPEGNPRIWTSDDGASHTSFEVQIREWRFPPGSTGNEAGGNPNQLEDPSSPGSPDEESIPFMS